MELHLEEVLHFYLRHIVHDKLVVQQCSLSLTHNYMVHARWNAHPVWHPAITNVLALVRCCPTHPLCRMLSWWQITRIVVCSELLRHVPQCHLAQQHQPSTVHFAGATVVGGLAHHICKVDSLSKHITSNRSFRRRDSEALRQNADKISESRAVPE